MSSPDRAGAVLTVNLGAVVANWRRLAARLRPGAQCGAAVKADAYGVGAAKATPALAAAGCAHFFVATIDEGIALRPLLGDARLYVLNGPFAGTDGDLLAHSLIPVLNCPEQVALWRQAALARGMALPAALHVDTGMARLGLTPAEAGALAEDPARLAGIECVLLMSHLACAEDAATEKNAQQLAAFRALKSRLPAMPASLANSSGIFLGPDYHFDLARPGAALYGVNPRPDAPNEMAQVVRLQGKIVQVRDVDRPMTVGYGATWRATGRGRIATVAVGYADGYPRSLSNRASGYIGEVRVPLVGRVSMDLVTFDVSAVDATLARPGNFIDLIGPHNPVDAVAAEAGTIGYEILTSLGRRHHRQYVGTA